MKKWLYFLILFIGGLFYHAVFSKNFYRYKNAKGHVEVKDSITKAMEKGGYDVINHLGKVIKHVKPSKTLAQIQHKLWSIKNKKEKKQKQIKRDAELLRQFRSVGDIIYSRDSQLLALAKNISIQRRKTKSLYIQLEEQQKKAAHYERLGQTTPKILLNDIDSSRKQIINNKKNTKKLEQVKYRIEEYFGQDILRYKALEATRLVLNRKSKLQTKKTLTIYECFEQKTCNKAWGLAKKYAKNNASGRIEIMTDTLILTYRDRHKKGIALSFSRIPIHKNKTQIILDVVCNKNKKITRHCDTEKAKNILQGYQMYVKKHLY
jgi:hypothetical protein